ncbi:MAG: Crp/Fnr family transcriptional regulator [Bacteroidetes bacterium]|nr:MAG: Crp/Fnr family transcriptional regulator [Bacteroidota bacterium]
MYINPNIALIQDPLVAAAMRLILSAGKWESVSKGDLILTQGQTCDFLFFVESGAFRAFRWIEDKEVTIGFTFSGDVDTCPYAFINHLPSLDTIEALSDGVIIRIYKSDIDKLIIQKPEFKDFLTTLLSHYTEILISRIIEYRILTAEEIYDNLLFRQPDEVAKIPLQYIASYLGISKERLSRIRKKHRN